MEKSVVYSALKETLPDYQHLLFGTNQWDMEIQEDSLKNGIRSDSSLGGVVVSVLATGPESCGFKTRPRRWVFKGDKNPQHTFLSDGQ
jgi:hypothetical protein